MIVAAVLKEKGSGVVVVEAATTVLEIAQTISHRRIGAVVVLDTAGSLIGIVSTQDVVEAIARAPESALGQAASEIMTRDVMTASPATTIEQAMEIMDAGYFRHLPVLDEGRMVGIISVRDLVRARIREQAYEVESLKSYLAFAEGQDGSGLANIAAAPQVTGSRQAGGKAFPHAEAQLVDSDLKYVVDRLAEFYSPGETRMWLHARHPLLKGARAVDLIHAGDADKVLAVIESLADANYT